MQREIKFRAWDKVDKVMKYFDYGIFNRLPAGAEDLTELMQYTGLKDKTGKAIYEGDIIKFEDFGEEGYEYIEGYDFINIASVCFNCGRFELENFADENSGVLHESDDHSKMAGTMVSSEVIGNVYDNPELLN